jgi:hypothetical protein
MHAEHTQTLQQPASYHDHLELNQDFFAGNYTHILTMQENISP